MPGRARGRALLLFGHIDTSFPADGALNQSVLGDPSRNAATRSTARNGRFAGQDAFNMRAGLAAGATAVAAVRRAGLQLEGSVHFAGLAGESEKVPIRTPTASFTGPAYAGAGRGARRYLRRAPHLDFAVSTGPSNLHVVNGQAGSAFVMITIRGQAAYLGNRDGSAGAAPLEVAAGLILAINAWARAYESQSTRDIGLGRIRPRVTIGAVEAGWPFSPVWSPASCRLYVNLRSSPAQSNAAAIASLSGAVTTFAATMPEIRFELKVYHGTESAVTPIETGLVQAALHAVAETTGRPSGRFPDGLADSTNDTNAFRAAGIPTIQLGPGERRSSRPGSGRPVPQVAVADIATAARIYVRLMLALCGEASSAPEPRAGGRQGREEADDKR